MCEICNGAPNCPCCSEETECPECFGSGRDREGLDCPYCGGTGFIENDYEPDNEGD